MKIAYGLIEQSSLLIEKCYNKDKGGYTHAIDSHFMDASGLQLITMSYLPHDSEKTRQHLIALEKTLKHGKALFYRYLHEDDFGKPSSTFLVCAFWYAEALACVGRVDEAMEVFDELKQYQNHLGLLSEDVGIDGSTWGNFPQTYSHMGLMNAAHRIERKLDKPLFD
jgi:GH15 family glucan-1,4-alpha-glucosidase